VVTGAVVITGRRAVVGDGVVDRKGLVFGVVMVVGSSVAIVGPRPVDEVASVGLPRPPDRTAGFCCPQAAPPSAMTIATAGSPSQLGRVRTSSV